jgi:RNA-directed DNA polymerase
MSIESFNLNIQSIDDLCKILEMSENELYSTIRNIDKFYKQSLEPKKNGGIRIIYKPLSYLKKIQRKILDNILSQIPLLPCVHAYRKKHSSLTNAKEHIGNKYLAKLDIKDFFPSVHFTRVQKLFSQIGCSLEVAKILRTLTTYQYCLPQGTPTAPYIANLIFYETDKILMKKCKEMNLVYTRYSDDIDISGNVNFSCSLDIFTKIVELNGFHISNAKLKFLRSGDRKIVTGLITNEKLNVSKKQIRELRAIIFNCIRYGVSSQNRDNKPNLRNSLYGRVNRIRSINPTNGDKLLQMLNRVNWNS